MSFEGTLKQAEAKTSKKGNVYHRILVEVDGRGVEWHTFFGTVDNSLLGARCAFAQKPLGEGMCVDTITLLEAAAVPVSTGQPSSQGATSTGGGHRDMWIAMESFYQHVVQPGADLDLMREYALEAMKLSIIANETFKAYDEGGRAAARQVLRAASGDEADPVAKVEDMADKAADAQSEASSDEFDDDIPF